MSNALAEAARTASTGTAVAPAENSKPVAIQRLEGIKNGIQAAIPATSQLDAERFVRVMSTEIQKNPKLNECTRESLLGAFLECASLGLEPGPLNLASIVPFSNSKKEGNTWVKVTEAQLIIEYRGFIELGYRGGLLKAVSLQAVHQGDVWKHYTDETGEHLYHESVEEDTDVIAYFGVFSLATGNSVIQVLTPKQVEARRKRASGQRVWDNSTKKMVVSEKPIGAWLSDYEAMALKTVVRAAENKLPKSTELARAFAADEAVVVNRAAEPNARAEANVIETEAWEANQAGSSVAPSPESSDPDANGEDPNNATSNPNASGSGTSQAETPPSDNSPKADMQQVALMQEAMVAAGLTSYNDQKAFVAQAISRNIRGFTNLTLDEVVKVCDAVEAKGTTQPPSQSAADHDPEPEGPEPSFTN